MSSSFLQYSIMIDYKDTAIIIPARLGSTRLKNKALELIGSRTMIEHTYLRALELGLEHLYIATDALEIASVVTKAGGKAIMTDKKLESGTDRIFQALQTLHNKNEIKYVINLQGDLPFVDSAIILDIISRLKNSEADIVTAASNIDYDTAMDPSNVKVVISNKGHALYFSRHMIPYNATNYWYHIGIYGYRSDALEKFVSLEPSYLEKTEKLEQLRALENNMKIDICYAKSIPISVDTQKDLEKARKLYNSFLS